MQASLLNARLARALSKDKKLLMETQVSIVTVSATFRRSKLFFSDLYADTQTTIDDESSDVVFSRAHYSMALAIAIQAWMKKKYEISFHRDRASHLVFPEAIPSEAWFVDPTNYVPSSQWKKIAFTEFLGKLIARTPILKTIKDEIDKRGRKELPIRSAIIPPLLHLFAHVHRPIISLHNETGNVLAGVGKKVLQVITDPYVRNEYLDYAHLSTMRFAVFDEKTKTDTIERAKLLNKKLDPDRVIVTGPPIDPRIVACASHKNPLGHTQRPLRICVTTGGLGTNKQEISQALHELMDFLRMRPHPVQLVMYAGTHRDFTKMVIQIAHEEHIPIENHQNTDAKLRLLFSDHIVDANELLIKYAFPWADCFITKPSGDMAYDAVASGASVLFLNSWGVWEDHVRDVFEQKEIGRVAELSEIKKQIEALLIPVDGESWFSSAMRRAQEIDPLFLRGAERILQEARNWAEEK